MKKIYIAGKISGLHPDEVDANFALAREMVEAIGYTAVSPLDNNCTSTCWADQMMACLPMLMECDGVFLLPNWSESDGAKIEKIFAEKSGKLIIEHSDNKPITNRS